MYSHLQYGPHKLNCRRTWLEKYSAAAEFFIGGGFSTSRIFSRRIFVNKIFFGGGGGQIRRLTYV
jgi:hypothetical protein